MPLPLADTDIIVISIASNKIVSFAPMLYEFSIYFQIYRKIMRECESENHEITLQEVIWRHVEDPVTGNCVIGVNVTTRNFLHKLISLLTLLKMCLFNEQ